MKILKKISKVIVIVMAVLATIWCGLYVYANYFYNDKQIDVENFYIAELPLGAYRRMPAVWKRGPA